ncbi:sugar phosphate isomerase/epimerase family protein [Flavobacterium sp. HJJ]|uniref:sugar phosphate isomerase/epimerase family protein n=1 Tax=Flavobacterium sp. HJJ TaxID=2783792 RepID=UPI001889E05A|nr:TIM barrel protein [Flavobacterium sp. HJJ]MBF4473034.1 sugar phosphate isomerase/epimerase [Flavobacterium sp. HJJ]
MVVQAIQQFQLRPVIGNEKQARFTLQAVKDAGYTAIELNGFMIRKMPLIVPLITWFAGMPIGRSGRFDWKKLIADSGLKVISIHEDLGEILKNPQKRIEEAKAYGANYIVITGMFRYDYSDYKSVCELAEKLNKAGKLLNEGGINLLYHNHNCEFRRVESGETAYQILLEKTDPQYVNFEFDSYWAIDAGCDAAQLMDVLGSRMKLWHVNDRGIRIKGKKGSILKSDSMELGDGNINLNALIETAKRNGVEAVILETHRNWVDNSPIKSFQRSAEFLNKYLKS